MTAMGYEALQRNPKYQRLVRERSALGRRLSAAMLIIYFGFILLVGYAPKFLATPLGTALRFERGGVAYAVIGSVPPATAEAAARGL